MATMWTISGPNRIKASACESWHWAAYDATGTRIDTGGTGFDGREVPTADELAAWDAEAPTTVPALIATKARESAVLRDAIKARFAGKCAVTGRTYQKGWLIKRVGMGWAIADEVTFTAPAPMSSPLGSEFDADERDAYAEDVRIAAAEMAQG